jgi:hypothetical protein
MGVNGNRRLARGGSLRLLPVMAAQRFKVATGRKDFAHSAAGHVLHQLS